MYTFVAKISSSAKEPNCINSTNIPLNYDKESSSPSGNTLLADMPITKPIYYITIQSNSGSTAGNVEFIMSDLYVETNDSNTNIHSGTYNYKFSNHVVANNFLYNSLNNLYLQFYKTSINDTVF
jgi:hypothetical protein